MLLDKIEHFLLFLAELLLFFRLEAVEMRDGGFGMLPALFS